MGKNLEKKTKVFKSHKTGIAMFMNREKSIGKMVGKLLYDSNMGAVIINPRMELVWFNKVFEEGFPQVKLKANPVCYKLLFSKSRKNICDNCPAIKTFKTGKVSFSETGVCSDGKIYNLTSTPKKDKSGKVIYVIETMQDITARKAEENKILHQKEFLYSAIESLSHPFYVVDAKDYTIKLANSTAQLGELSPKSTCYGITHKSGRPCFKDGYPCTLQEVKKTKKPVVVEHVHYDKKGEARHVEVHAYPIFDKKGKVMQIIEYCLDITKQKKAQEALNLSEKKYRDLTENAIVGIYKTNLKGDILYANKELADIFDFMPLEKIMHFNMAGFYKSRNDYEAFIQLLKMKGKVEGLELEILTEAKIIKHILVDALLEDDEISGMVMDITRRKHAERALRESEANYSDIFNFANDIIVIYDIKSAKVVNANKKMLDIFAYSELEIKKMDICDLSLGYPPYSKKELYNFVAEAIDGKPQVFEWRCKTKEAGLFWAEISLKHIVLNQRQSILAIIRDISERKKSEGMLHESSRRYHALFEDSPVALLEEDFSNIKIFIDLLKKKGIVDFRAYFEANPDAITDCMSMVKILDANKSALTLFEADDKNTLISNPKMTLAEESLTMFKEELIAIGEGKSVFDCELIVFTLKGNKIDVYVKWSVPPIYEQTLAKTLVSFVNITERKHTERKLKEINKELIKSSRRLNELVLRDYHTGVYNHRYLAEVIETEFVRANRYTQSLSVIMLDIDYFKSINKVYGHEFGDLVLKQFARQLKRMVRRYDIIIRFGGEEFVIICPGIDVSSAINLSQRLSDAISLYNFGNNDTSIRLKLSMSVVSYPEDRAAKGMELVELADKILDKAKYDGGGRVYSHADILKNKKENYMDKSVEEDVSFLKGKLDKLTRQTNQSLMEAVFAFAKTIELKDHYTGEHVENTVEYADSIAKALMLSKEDIVLIRQAAALHDLGKVGISEKILLKRTPLSGEEFEEIKKHPQIAVDIIRPVHFLRSMIPLMLYHHEKWDGTGYPSGLRGEDIPMGARIIAIADVYQALISDRPYRKAYSKDEAIKIIKDGAGSQFDPAIVNAFMPILEKNEI